MKTIDRLSAVVGKIYLCEGADIPLREGFFHSSKELGVYVDELDALLSENPYSVFRALFKKVKSSADRVLSKNNQVQMELRKQRLANMLAVFDSVPELHNDSGKRWHVYNPPFLPLEIFEDLMFVVSKNFNRLCLADAPEIKRMQEQTGIVPLIWFEAWKNYFESELEFIDKDHIVDRDIEWHREFIDHRLKHSSPSVNQEPVKETPKMEDVSVVVPEEVTVEEPSPVENGVVTPLEPDSVTEMLLGKRAHYPIVCDATLQYTMEFEQGSPFLASVIERLRIRDIDAIDDVKIGPNNTVELTILTTIVDGYPAKVNIQKEKLERLTGIIDFIYDKIYKALEEVDKQAEELMPLIGAAKIQTEQKEPDDNNIH